jgi:integrase
VPVKKTKRPSPITVGKVRIRVKRGPREDGRWYWRADRAVGHREREDVWVGWATPDEATEAVKALPGQATAAAASEGQVRTVFDLLDCWVGSQNERADVSPRTAATCKAAADRLCATQLCHVRLDALDRLALERHRDGRVRIGDGASTIARDLKYLRQAWRWGREVGVAPARDLPTIRVEQRESSRVYTDYTPTRVEVAQLIGAATGWVRQALVLLWATGARIGELADLTWADVDGGALTLDGKTGSRTVPLHPSIWREVATWERRRPADRVLPVSRSRVVVRVGTWLAEASARLRLGGQVSPHGIRRAVVDALYAAGVGPDREAALLGHSAATALAHYRKVRAHELADATIQAGLDLPVPDGAVLQFPARS